MSVRLLITADLHFNHARSRPVATDLIAEINQAGGDAVLIIGDTGIYEGDSVEQCLSLFKGFSTKLFVAGNHEMWTKASPDRPDALTLMNTLWPRRIEAFGWTWLSGHPVELGDVTIVGSMGWYDYSFAQPSLGIPNRFYAHKVSPGAAARFSEFAGLFDQFTPDDPDRTTASDLPRSTMNIVARWNDGRHVLLPAGFTDENLVDHQIEQLTNDLNAVRSDRTIIAAVHHVPFRELLPPAHGSQWDFAKAYLGSDKIGAVLTQFPNVKKVFCGHSHFPARAVVGETGCVNIGSGYRLKTFIPLDIG